MTSRLPWGPFAFQPAAKDKEQEGSSMGSFNGPSLAVAHMASVHFIGCTKERGASHMAIPICKGGWDKQSSPERTGAHGKEAASISAFIRKQCPLAKLAFTK